MGDIEAARGVLSCAGSLAQGLALLVRYRDRHALLAAEEETLRAAEQRGRRAGEVLALRIRASVLEQAESETRDALQCLLQRRLGVHAESHAALALAADLEARGEALASAVGRLGKEAAYLQAVELPLCLDGLAAAEQALASSEAGTSGSCSSGGANESRDVQVRNNGLLDEVFLMQS